VIVQFADIGRIVDYHCLNFLFIIFRVRSRQVLLYNQRVFIMHVC